MPMNISASDDSSSLLPITEQQNRFPPGTGAVDTETVRVAPLYRFLSEKEIIRPALFKVDVQGFEREVLEGCKHLLSLFDLIYFECSFVELYAGQALASEIFEWLLGGNSAPWASIM
jgi:FkbM family methyltransferase